MKRKWTEEEKREVVRRCDAAKENGETVKAALEDLGASCSQLSKWRRDYREIPEEVYQAFGVEPEKYRKSELEADAEEDGRLNVNDEYRRETIAINLFMSGYIVWQTCEAGDYFVNFQKQ